mmetsp:Transcript_25952/g.36569  ORF Transcript_25952/g.36569 Transcript_25952/m.36569 type:complete len:260 (+) Transcript_25952:120-899(+)
MTGTISDSVKALIENVELLDQEEAPVSSREIIGVVSLERLAIWATREDVASVIDPQNDTIIAVKCVGSDGETELEHAVKISNNDTHAEAIMIECKVSYEEMSPSALVEYKYQDDATVQDQWRLSLVSLPYLLSFRAGKFKMWEQRMVQPTCKAEFRRMFAIGPVYQIFDHIMFPSPPEERSQFDVIDDASGKKIILPRPVSALRIWNTTTQSYDVVDSTLDGTPTTDAERELYWTNLVTKLKETFGEEIEDIMKQQQQK